MARWTSDNAIIQGHFPGFPLVPGVMLIEAVTQLAGAGLLSADDYARSLPRERIGVLAAVRRCAFKRPVSPDQTVVFDIHCRQIGPDAVQITAQASVNGHEVAQIETLMAYVDKSHLPIAEASSAPALPVDGPPLR